MADALTSRGKNSIRYRRGDWRNPHFTNSRMQRITLDDIHLDQRRFAKSQQWMTVEVALLNLCIDS